MVFDLTPLTLGDGDLDQILRPGLLARYRGPWGALVAQRVELGLDLLRGHRLHGPLQPEPTEALEL